MTQHTSSAAERSSHKREAPGAALGGRTIFRTRSLKPEWRGSGLLTRWRKPDAGSNPAWSSNLCSVTHLVKRPDCLSGERDSISLRSANNTQDEKRDRSLHQIGAGLTLDSRSPIASEGG